MDHKREQPVLNVHSQRQAVLYKIKSTHSNINDRHAGYFKDAPTVGNDFWLLGPTVREYVHTTPVVEVKFNAKLKEYWFRTKNSEYRLTIF